MVEEETIEEKRKVEGGETEEFQILSDEKENFIARPTGYLSLCLNFEKVKLM